MPKPLAEVLAAVEANPKLRKTLGRARLFEACQQCTLSNCNPERGGCNARRMHSQRMKDYYAARKAEFARRRREYYAAHREAEIERSRNYRSGEVASELRAVKDRARRAARRAQEGREVRKYTWRTPERNQGRKTA